MARPKIRKKARELRKQGWRIVDIAAELDTHKDSIIDWCRDIELTDDQIQEIAKDNPKWKVQHDAAQKIKVDALRKRMDYQNVGREQTQNGSLLHLMGCMLYWAEGAKHRQQLKLTNTDPNMLVLFAKFLREELNVPDKKFVLHILTHTDDETEQERIKRYWLEILNLPLTNKVMISLKVGAKSRKARYENGICSIAIYSTEIVQQVFGAIQAYIGFENPKWVE